MYFTCKCMGLDEVQLEGDVSARMLLTIYMKILETSQLMRRVNAKGWWSMELDGNQLPFWHQGLPSTSPENSFSGSWSHQAADRVGLGSAFCAGMAGFGDMGTVMDMSPKCLLTRPPTELSSESWETRTGWRAWQADWRLSDLLNSKASKQWLDTKWHSVIQRVSIIQYPWCWVLSQGAPSTVVWEALNCALGKERLAVLGDRTAL